MTYDTTYLPRPSMEAPLPACPDVEPARQHTLESEPTLSKGALGAYKDR